MWYNKDNLPQRRRKMPCFCNKCGRQVDCGDTVCPLCELDSEFCPNGTHCEIEKEVSPGVFLTKKDDGSYTLERRQP
jgi:hypothetical protein